LTRSFTQTATYTQQLPAENIQPLINNVVIYPDPYNPHGGDLKIMLEITGNIKLFQIRIYTAGFRLIKNLSIPGNYNTGLNNLIIASRYLQYLANGVYYILVTGKNYDNTEIYTKPCHLIILR
jgi:hypothetical protein